MWKIGKIEKKNQFLRKCEKSKKKIGKIGKIEENCG